MKKMIGFGTTEGNYGLLEEKELLLYLKENKKTIYKQEVATFYECLEHVAMGETIAKGVYIVSDGIMEVGSQFSEYGEPELISNLILC
ncbi:hypothetical protein [Clostridium estertheticum]|uniref:hypothetical protein n=1 Tax=Clostridium estertheticum TaxID=238834 RepID=UPI00124CB84B|nr:hypothetical protein [Clostridium estertheticum]MBZ9616769.1 hypothetical protein [Clostridium estertheticum subsp. laramiense]WAG72476.1 hypothetical protein LL032_15125 [Clostridium estertheticum]